jgi:hypothetical protein
MRLSSDIAAFSPLKEWKDGLYEMSPLNSKLKRLPDSSATNLFYSFRIEFRKTLSYKEGCKSKWYKEDRVLKYLIKTYWETLSLHWHLGLVSSVFLVGSSDGRKSRCILSQPSSTAIGSWFILLTVRSFDKHKMFRWSRAQPRLTCSSYSPYETLSVGSFETRRRKFRQAAEQLFLMVDYISLLSGDRYPLIH